MWDLRYIDAPVAPGPERGGGRRRGDGHPGLEERVYYTNDANMNVTALVNTSGTVVERYVYDPYGKVTFLMGDWSLRTATAARGRDDLASRTRSFIAATGTSRRRGSTLRAPILPSDAG